MKRRVQAEPSERESRKPMTQRWTWGLALAALVLAACPTYGSLGSWEQLGAAAAGSPAGSGGASGSTSAIGTGGRGGSGTGGAEAELCTPGLDGGTVVWGQRYGDTEDQWASTVATDAMGNVYVTGSFNGVLDFGGTPLSVAPPVYNAFVAKLDPTGGYLWSKAFGAPNALSTAVDAAGNIVVNGLFDGSIDLGCGTLVGGANGGSSYAAKLDPNGACVWSQAGGVGPVAVDAAGNVFLAGRTSGVQLPLDGGTPGTLSITKLDATTSGASLWSQSFDCSSDEANISGIAADALGNVIVTGSLIGTVDFGGGALTSMGTTLGDVFVAKFNPDGTYLWSKAYSGVNAAYNWIPAVAVDPSGDVFITGDLSGSEDFDGIQLASIGMEDLYVAKLDPSGVCLWAKDIGGPMATTLGWRVAADKAGNVFITGSFVGSVNVGGAILTSTDEGDTMLVSLDPLGNLRWANRLGDPQSDWGWGIAVDPFCHVLLAGGFRGTIEATSSPLVSAGQNDVFVLDYVR